MSVITDTFFGGAEKKAARAREAGFDAATEEQRRQYNQTRQDLQPGITRGNQAGAMEADFLGLNGREAEQAAIDNFIESPGQAFLRQRAERSLLRNNAAIGGLGGGNVRGELNEQAIGIAAGQLGERKDRLRGVASAGDYMNINRANFGQNSANSIANNEIGIGDARATGIIGQAAGMRRGLGAVAGAFTGAGGLGGLGLGASGLGASQLGSGGGALGLTKTFVNPLTGR